MQVPAGSSSTDEGGCLAVLFTSDNKEHQRILHQRSNPETCSSSAELRPFSSERSKPWGRTDQRSGTYWRYWSYRLLVSLSRNLSFTSFRPNFRKLLTRAIWKQPVTNETHVFYLHQPVTSFSSFIHKMSFSRNSLEFKKHFNNSSEVIKWKKSSNTNDPTDRRMKVWRFHPLCRFIKLTMNSSH